MPLVPNFTQSNAAVAENKNLFSNQVKKAISQYQGGVTSPTEFQEFLDSDLYFLKQVLPVSDVVEVTLGFLTNEDLFIDTILLWFVACTVRQSQKLSSSSYALLDTANQQVLERFTLSVYTQKVDSWQHFFLPLSNFLVLPVPLLEAAYQNAQKEQNETTAKDVLSVIWGSKKVTTTSELITFIKKDPRHVLYPDVLVEIILTKSNTPTIIWSENTTTYLLALLPKFTANPYWVSYVIGACINLWLRDLTKDAILLSDQVSNLPLKVNINTASKYAALAALDLRLGRPTLARQKALQLSSMGTFSHWSIEDCAVLLAWVIAETSTDLEEVLQKTTRLIKPRHSYYSIISKRAHVLRARHLKLAQQFDKAVQEELASEQNYQGRITLHVCSAQFLNQITHGMENPSWRPEWENNQHYRP